MYPDEKLLNEIKKREADFLAREEAKSSTELANDALIEDQKATPGPWKTCHADGNDGECSCGLIWAPKIDATLGRVYSDDGTMETCESAGTRDDWRWIAHARSREPKLAAALLESLDEIKHLRTRQQTLLETIVRLTNETPYPHEAEDWMAQRSAMIAEVGTLRSQVAEGNRGFGNGIAQCIKRVERRLEHYKLMTGDMMKANPATIATLEEMLIFLQADLSRAESNKKDETSTLFDV